MVLCSTPDTSLPNTYRQFSATGKHMQLDAVCYLLYGIYGIADGPHFVNRLYRVFEMFPMHRFFCA
jgi:hypothetical protein